MATRKTSVPEELPRPSLLIPKAEAAAKIADQIAIGKNLRDRSFNNEADFRQARTELREWHDYNRELLGVIFSNEKFSNEYSHGSHGRTVMASHISQEIDNYYHSVAAKLTALSSILKRLDLIIEQPSTPDQAVNFVPQERQNKPSAQNTYNVTGTVIVGDIVSTLEAEIEKLPDSNDKAKALAGLRAILSNETFANVTGAAVGSFLSHLLK